MTTRGRCFLAAAGAAALAASILGEKDLLRVATLLVALPLLAVWYVGRSRYRLSCRRSLDPRRIQAQATARVVLRLENLSRFPTGTMLLEDRIPYALGSRPRLVLERLEAQRGSSVGYTVRADVRGKYGVGPLVVRLTDPFGLCEMVRSFPTVDHLVVTPQLVELPAVALTGDLGGTGDSRSRSVASHGEDDTATREYRRGDDLRRVHWRSTARMGELMVRREEQPWESRATVLLDTRRAAHRGEGATSSFEWAVSAAASIAVHLRHHRYRVRLATGSGPDVAADKSPDQDTVILDRLAEVRLSQRSSIARPVDEIRKRHDSGLVVAVLGSLTKEEAQQLAALRLHGTTCVALAIDSSTWTAKASQHQREDEPEQHESALILARAGWRVIPVRHGDRLAALWPRAARGSQGFAFRATMAETVSGVRG